MTTDPLSPAERVVAVAWDYLLDEAAVLTAVAHVRRAEVLTAYRLLEARAAAAAPVSA